MMEKRKIAYAFLAFVTLHGCFNVSVSAQGGLISPALLKAVANMPWEQKAGLLINILDSNEDALKKYIVDHEQVFQALQDFIFKLLSFDTPSGVLVKEALPWVLGSLRTAIPSALDNQAVLGILRTVITEINAQGMNPKYNFSSGNTTLDRMYFMSNLLGDLDYLGLIQNVLTMRSLRDVVPYKSTNRQLDGQCYNDTMAFLDRLFAGDRWALDMIDAVGKPSPGIDKGVLYFIGNYDQCAKIVAKIPANASLGEYLNADDVTFNTRYCRSTFKLPVGLVNAVASKHANNTYGIPMTLSWGMCLPESCHAQDLEGLLNLGFLGTLFNATLENAVCTEKPDYGEDTSAIVVTVVLGGLALIVLLCSIIDLFCLKQTKHKHMEELNGDAGIPYLNHAYDNNIDDVDAKTDDERYSRMPGELESEMTEMKHGTKMGVELTRELSTVVTHRKSAKRSTEENMSVDSDRTEDALAIEKSHESLEAKIVRSFSIFTNAPAIVSEETREDDIPCLYGIRFISMLWIMLGNTYIYAALSLSDVPVSVNLMDTFDIMKRFTFQVVLSATFATDTFFVISGCLTAYWYLMKLEERSRKVDIRQWLKFYAGKYWKMTPPYMLVLAVMSYLYVYLGDGPVWPKSIKVGDDCHSNWWKNLLYVNNLVGVDGVSAEDQCMAWSWYLAVNMQFYLIAPILLTFISFSSALGLILVLILAAAGIVSAGIKEHMYGGDILTSRTDGGAYWNNVFIKPWCRVAAFCIGIALGYVLKNWFHKKLNRILAAVLWLLSVCLAVLIVYCSYSKYADDARPWTSAETAAYEALSRPVWALCVAWLVYACSTELAGPISDFLSWKGFVPVSRLTFMVYLVHPVVMVLTTYSRRSLIYINDFEMTYIFLGHVVISYSLAFIATIIVDLPFRNLKRILSGKTLERQLKTIL